MEVKQDSLPKIIATALITTCLFAIILSACQAKPSNETEARVIVTQNFGNELVLDETVIISDGVNALDALQ